MTLTYPPEIAPKDFRDGRGLGAARARANQRKPLVQKCNLQQDTAQELCSLLELTVNNGVKTSVSYPSTDHLTIGADDELRVNFAPKLETLKIAWKIKNIEGATGGKLEIFRRKHTTPVFSKTLSASELGQLSFDYQGETASRSIFPSGYLNVEQGPFKVKLTLEGTVDEQVKSCFTYFDVLIGSIKLSWGKYTEVPKDRADIKPENLVKILGNVVQRTKGLEELAFDEVVNDNPAPGANLKHKIRLTSHNFKKTPFGKDNKESEDTTDFQLHKELWGNGARLPIKAKVHVKMANGNDTDQAPEALQDCRLIWNWHDPDLKRWRTDLQSTRQTMDYMRDIFSQNENAEPANVANCPKELGGRLGDTDCPIFRTCDGSGPFPFEVNACSTRTWAAFSKIKPDGSSGVIFYPSRIAGDFYNVSCAIFFDPGLDSKAEVTIPAAAKAEAGTFEVFKKVKVHYIVRGTQALLGCDPAAIPQPMKDIYENECKIILDMVETTTDNIVYSRALKAGCDDAEKTPKWYANNALLPLMTRNLIDFNPPADSPALVLKSHDQMFQSIEQKFQSGRVRMVTFKNLKAGPPIEDDNTVETTMLRGEEIKGKSSDSKGIIVDVWSPNQDRPFPVLLEAGRELRDEGVEGQASKATADISVAGGRNCWGHSYTEETDANDSHFDQKVDVTFGGGQPVVIKFSKKGIKRILSVVVSEEAKRDLEVGLATAGNTHNEDDSLAIIIKHKGKQSTNHNQRIANIKTTIDELLAAGKGMLDRKAIFEKLKSSWIQVDNTGFKNTAKQFFDFAIGRHVFDQYVRLKYPNETGMFLFHFPGLSNTRVHVPTHRELQLTGANFGDALRDKRDCGACYVATIDPNGEQVLQMQMKSIGSIFAHEAGHALFLPHAPTSIPGGDEPAGANNGVHVKGDSCLMNYDLDSEHFCGVCMLRMRGWDWSPLPNTMGEQEYHVTLAVDDVNSLFSAPVTAKQGRKERLQFLGLLNLPLNHPEIDDAFNFCWNHLQELLDFDEDNDDIQELYDCLETWISHFIVDGGVLPGPGEFAKIRIAAGHTARHSQNFMEATIGTENERSLLAAPYEALMLGANRYTAEQAIHALNPSLGKIPLKATVKRRPKGSTEPWELCPEPPKVYFQLVKPDDLSTAKDPTAKSVRVAGGTSYYPSPKAPALNDKPKAYYDARVVKYTPTPGLADSDNVHVDLGGKRGGPSVFTKDQASDFAPIAYSGPFPKAVIVEADGQGVARVVFDPSRIGGDTYKLRVFVGPPTQFKTAAQLDKGGDDIVVTGTMVRWRTVRACYQISMDGVTDANDLPAEYCKDSKGGLMPEMAKYLGQLPTIDLSDLATKELARSFCELVIEPNAQTATPISQFAQDITDAAVDLASRYPKYNSTFYPKVSKTFPFLSIHKEPMTLLADGANDKFSVVLQGKPHPGSVAIRPAGGDENSALASDNGGAFAITSAGAAKVATVAIDYGNRRVDAQFQTPQDGKKYEVCYHIDEYLEIDRLIGFPQASPFLFNMALPRVYNGRIANTTKPADYDPNNEAAQPTRFYQFMSARSLGFVLALMMDSTVRGINRNNGFYPGLLFFTAMKMDNYTGAWPGGDQGGKGVGNGIFVYAAGRPKSDFDWLLVHEMSHGLFLEHAEGGGAEGAKPDLHDKSDTCVMSYLANDGDHCGHCVAALRGIKTQEEPMKPST